MNEEEIIFNKLHDIFKNSALNKKTLKVIEGTEPANVNKEKNKQINFEKNIFKKFYRKKGF